MIQNLCGNDPVKWKEATIASENALKMRIKLWDSILEKVGQLTHKKSIINFYQPNHK